MCGCLPSLKLAAGLPLKIHGWNMNFPLGWSIFRGKPLVSNSTPLKVHMEKSKCKMLKSEPSLEKDTKLIDLNLQILIIFWGVAW